MSSDSVDSSDSDDDWSASGEVDSRGYWRRGLPVEESAEGVNLPISPGMVKRDVDHLLAGAGTRDDAFAWQLLERLSAGLACWAPTDLPSLPELLSPPLLEVLSQWLSVDAAQMAPRSLMAVMDHFRLLGDLLKCQALDADQVLRALCHAPGGNGRSLAVACAEAMRREPQLAHAFGAICMGMNQQRYRASAFMRDAAQSFGTGVFSGERARDDSFCGRLLDPALPVLAQPGALLAIRYLDRLGCLPDGRGLSDHAATGSTAAWREARAESRNTHTASPGLAGPDVVATARRLQRVCEQTLRPSHGWPQVRQPPSQAGSMRVAQWLHQQAAGESPARRSRLPIPLREAREPVRPAERSIDGVSASESRARPSRLPRPTGRRDADGAS